MAWSHCLASRHRALLCLLAWAWALVPLPASLPFHLTAFWVFSVYGEFGLGQWEILAMNIETENRHPSFLLALDQVS